MSCQCPAVIAGACSVFLHGAMRMAIPRLSVQASGFRLPVSTAEQSFWWLARFRLPEGEVIDEVKLDVLPTGRVCWVPEYPGRIMFAAGDGQLYCHDFPGW